MLPNLDDIKNIDDSISDIYSIQEYIPRSYDKSNERINFDEIITLGVPKEHTPKGKIEGIGNKIKRSNETNDQSNRMLLVPHETKPSDRKSVV